MNFAQQQLYLIQQLKRKARNLGRIPNHLEMGKNYPSYTVYEQVFGSWGKAIQAAGLNYSKQFIPTEKEAIAFMQKAYRELEKKNLHLSFPNYKNLIKEKTPSWPTLMLPMISIGLLLSR